MKALRHSNILILESSALVVFTVIDTIWETVSVEKGNLFSRWKPYQVRRRKIILRKEESSKLLWKYN